MDAKRGYIQQNSRIFKFILNSFSVFLDPKVSLLNLRKNKNIANTVLQNIDRMSGQNILEISYLKNALWQNDKSKVFKINPLYDINTSVLNQFLATDYVSQDAKFVNCGAPFITEINLQSDCFDSCYLSLTYEDILLFNKAYDLSEIKRVLKKDGLLYFSQQNYMESDIVNNMLSSFDARLCVNRSPNCFIDELGFILKTVKSEFEEVNHIYYKNDYFSCHIDDFICDLLINPNIKNVKQVISERGVAELKNYLLSFCKNGDLMNLPSRYDLIVCRK